MPNFQDRVGMMQQNMSNQRLGKQGITSPLGNYSDKEVFEQPQAVNPIIAAIMKIISSTQQKSSPSMISPLAKETPTPTASPSPSPTPSPFITPYATPTLNQEQSDWAKQLSDAAIKRGLQNPDIIKGIGMNESSLKPRTVPNVNEYEESYGPAQINLKAHPQITREQAENTDFAKDFMTKRLKTAEKLFPGSIEKQILYYNVPKNAYLEPGKLSDQAAWYLGNALKNIGKVPSKEYLPVLQRIGFFK